MDLLTFFGVLIVFLILISPILAIILEEVYKKKTPKTEEENL